MNTKSRISPNIIIKQELGHLDKIALWVTDKVGSVGFFLVIFVWTAAWFAWNTFAPNDLKFDPFPSFVLWLFISNVVQIFLLPLLLIGQNLQGKHNELRAESDFEINLKAEREIEIILTKLGEQGILMERMLKRLDINEKPVKES